MSEMNVRADAVDVEQIMRQIRARIREKRGADYTEAELQQLATVKLEKFLDPKGLRSNLVSEYRRTRVVEPPIQTHAFDFEFGEDTLYATHRGVLRSVRRLLRPILKLFFNPDRLTSAMHDVMTSLRVQAAANTQIETRLRKLEDREPLSYELLHNLTLEITRLGIEVHNLKMRVESLSSRLDFDERRAKSLESVVEYRQPPTRQLPAEPAEVSTAPSVAAPSVPSAGGPRPAGAEGQQASGRRRRRRRRRRPGGTMAEGQGQTWSREPGGQPGPAADVESADEGPDDGPDDDGPDLDRTGQ
jgi:hypothetical protein